MDRAHVLASAGLDRHAAYVALTRHRGAVALHYGRDAFGDAAGLARALGRERAKETTLDYAAAFAARRGLALEEPGSGIVVTRASRTSAVESEPSSGAAPRKGRFAGLRLGPARGSTRVGGERPRPDIASEPDPRTEAVAAYARAHADAQRMRDGDLPVLAHQELALARAGAQLAALDRGAVEDLRGALAWTPGLAAAAGTAEGRAALTGAMAEERRLRADPALRAERYAARWHSLERAQARATGPRQERFGAALDALARAIERDPEARAAMGRRARVLGIDPGSRLERVVAGRPAPELGRPERERDLDRGR